MKYLLYLCIVTMTIATASSQSTGFTPVDNIASSIINQLNVLSRQITAAQSVATELSRSIGNFVATSTRLVQGLNAENESPDATTPASAWSGITSSFVDGAMANPLVVILSNQVNQLQRALTDISMSVQRMIDSGSRIITGAPSYDASADDATTTENRADNTIASVPNTLASSGSQIFSRAVELASQQMAQTQRAIAEMRDSMQAMVATGSRVVAGDLGPTPIGTTIDFMQSVTREVNNIQSTMRQINNEFNRMIAAGTRSIVGGGGSAPSLGHYQDSNEDEAVASGLSDLADQLDRLQKVFAALSRELGQSASNSVNRVINPHHAHHTRVKRADALVVNGLQRAAGEITQNLGALGGTLARIAGGMTGIRIPGSNVGLPTDTNGNRQIDDSHRAFSGLNPIGVIGRGVGNIANSISRIVPTTGK